MPRRTIGHYFYFVIYSGNVSKWHLNLKLQPCRWCIASWGWWSATWWCRFWCSSSWTIFQQKLIEEVRQHSFIGLWCCPTCRRGCRCRWWCRTDFRRWCGWYWWSRQLTRRWWYPSWSSRCPWFTNHWWRGRTASTIKSRDEKLYRGFGIRSAMNLEISVLTQHLIEMLAQATVQRVTMIVAHPLLLVLARVMLV